MNQIASTCRHFFFLLTTGKFTGSLGGFMILLWFASLLVDNWEEIGEEKWWENVEGNWELLKKIYWWVFFQVTSKLHQHISVKNSIFLSFWFDSMNRARREHSKFFPDFSQFCQFVPDFLNSPIFLIFSDFHQFSQTSTNFP